MKYAQKEYKKDHLNSPVEKPYITSPTDDREGTLVTIYVFLCSNLFLLIQKLQSGFVFYILLANRKIGFQQCNCSTLFLNCSISSLSL